MPRSRLWKRTWASNWMPCSEARAHRQTIAELVVRKVPDPVAGSPHRYKCRLAYVVNGVCRVRYDNERGKGDHRHLDGKESPYAFRGLEQLLTDFWRDVNKRR